MIYLPDINVWIAAASSRHVHHRQAQTWLYQVETDQIAFCRITELGFLRLLTNRHVMGEDVLDHAGAWKTYDQMRRDRQVIFLSERTNFSEHWRSVGSEISGGSDSWTDAYLAAFAAYSEATVVTFDQNFKAVGNCKIVTLSK